VIVDALQIVLPVPVLVDLIEENQRLGRVLSWQAFVEEGILDELSPAGRDIPIEVEAVSEV